MLAAVFRGHCMVWLIGEQKCDGKPHDEWASSGSEYSTIVGGSGDRIGLRTDDCACSNPCRCRCQKCRDQARTDGGWGMDLGLRVLGRGRGGKGRGSAWMRGVIMILLLCSGG